MILSQKNFSSIFSGPQQWDGELWVTVSPHTERQPASRFQAEFPGSDQPFESYESLAILKPYAKSPGETYRTFRKYAEVSCGDRQREDPDINEDNRRLPNAEGAMQFILLSPVVPQNGITWISAFPTCG